MSRRLAAGSILNANSCLEDAAKAKSNESTVMGGAL